MDSIKSSEDISNSLTIIDFIRIFLKYKKILFGVSLVCGIIMAFLMFFVVPPIFQSSGVVKITPKSSGLGSMIGSSASIPGLGDVGDLTGASSTTKELALYENIILSRRCLEETINKFNLNDEWGFKYMQDAVKHLRNDVIEIKKDKIAGTMEILVLDKYQNRAKEVCDYLIFELNKINTEMNALNAKNNKEFIEMRYNSIKNDLKIAEDSLKIYQDIYGVVPDLKIKAVAQAELTLETELKSEEIKLELLKKILSPEQAELKIQQDKIDAIKKQIMDLKNNPKDDQFSFSLKGSPDILINYMRLTRNVEIQSKLIAYILPVYEQAKLEEKRETPSVIVLDQPNFPEVKAKPKRVTSILITVLISFFLTYVSILIYRYLIINILNKIREKN
jgi:tyrosine-protein kinase Etk/Wzc